MKKTLLVVLCSCFFVCKLFAQTPTLEFDINSGPGPSNPSGFTIFNNSLYFMAGMPQNKSIWRYTSGSVSWADYISSGETIIQYFPAAFANTKAYFAGTTLFQSVQGAIWYYNGASIPVMFSGGSGITKVEGSNLVTLNNKVYFSGTDGAAVGIMEIDPFVSNYVVPANTHSSQSITSSNYLLAYNSKLYYIGMGTSREFYIYDPGTTNTSQLTSSCPTGCTYLGLSGSSPVNPIVGDNNKLYYSALSQADGRELYEINGSASPVKLTNLNGSSDGLEGYTSGEVHTKNIIKWGNYIYFSGNNGTSGFELMRLDLSNNNVTVVKDIATGSASSSPREFVVYGSKLFFSANTAANGRELWSTDGTGAGTNLVNDLNPGSASSNPKLGATFDNKLFFAADNGTVGEEIFSLNSTAGIEVLTKVSDIKVYPVPATDKVSFDMHLTVSGGFSISLTDLSGKIVHTTPVEFHDRGRVNITVPVKDLATGIYTYTINSASGAMIATGTIAR